MFSEVAVDSQVEAEGKELYRRDYPDVAEDIANSYGTRPRYSTAFGEDHLTVFRGDTEEVFQDLLEDGDLVRDFPIYFTDSEDAAEVYADRKFDDSGRLVLEIEVPYEDVEILDSEQSDIEQGDVEVEPGKLYYVGSNMAPGPTEREMEFVGTEIPEEWYSVRQL
ncbi:hypothetical protein [Candidatus Nanohalovita haloferacivicina]|uniref:hypothetical protein n=1 Tax=Candidatus Nanohalovita haloferacivicina TaxID=2978046 RepID=UPI00325FCBA5|nr:hypothetical protein HBNXNv_1009 [Candidatus Nanohalobia archaeon BNXNv]